jgi:hypothetical protein
LIIPILTWSCEVVHGQKLFRDSTLTLSELKLTNAPAFSLLDISPSSIETTPTTKTIGISIANAINQGNGVPQNLAIEVTPFWLFKHKKMTDYKYFGVNKDYKKNSPLSQARFFSISLAVINKDSTTNIGTLANHNVGFGVRTTVIKCYSKSSLKSIRNAKYNWYNSQMNFLLQHKAMAVTTAQIDSFEKGLYKWQREEDKSDYGDTIKTIMQAKPLFALDAAFATNLAFDSNSMNSSRISKTGLWANAVLSIDLTEDNPGTNYLNIYAIGRYINTSDSIDAAGKYVSYNLVDFGGKTEFQLGKISIAYEYIQRYSSDNSTKVTFKSVGIIQYKIKDGLFITGSIGQNFTDIRYLNNRVTTLGLNWGFADGVVKLKD